MSWFDSGGWSSVLNQGEVIVQKVIGKWVNQSSQGGMFDKSYVSGLEYYAGLHLGVCHGPVDEIWKILFRGKSGWEGLARPGYVTQDAEGFFLPYPRDQENPRGVEKNQKPTLGGPIIGPPQLKAPEDFVDTLIINQRNLFGGEKVEGGVLGIVNILHGGRDQGIHPYLDEKLRDPDSNTFTPGYRGILSLVFHSEIRSFKNYADTNFIKNAFPIIASNREYKYSEPVTYHTGFYWGCNTPSIKEVSLHLFRAKMGWNSMGLSPGDCWYAEKCVVTRDGKKFMNPVHIVVQCLTDIRCGMKAPISKIGDSFQRCADQLWDKTTTVGEVETVNTYIDQYGNELPTEGVGLGIVWSGENTIRVFLADIMRYIHGNIYIDHATGMIEMVLIREVPEASIGELPLLSGHQIIDIGTLSQPLGEEAINTVDLVYSDYDTEKTETVTRSNAAMVSIYADTITETLQMPGFKNAGMAAEACEREVRQRCALASTYTRMRVTLSPSDTGVNSSSALLLYEGAPFRLQWPAHNRNGEVFRATNISYGTITDNFVEFDAVQDMFGLVSPDSVIGSPTSGGSPLSSSPSQFISGQVKYFSVPYITLLGIGGVPLISNLSTDAGLLGVMATTPSQVTTGVELYANTPGSGSLPPNIYASSNPAQLMGSGSLCPTCKLAEDLPLLSLDYPGELQHTVRITSFNRMSEHTIEGAWFFIGSEKVRCASIDKEPFLIDGETPNPDYLMMTLERGVYDSIPTDHYEGETVWWYNGAPDSAAWSSAARYSEGDSVRIFASPLGRNGNTLLTPASFYETVTADNAWYAPYPPANVKIDGELAPTYIHNREFTIEWACRNRVSQSDVAVAWDADGVDPEDGTSYNVRVYDDDTNTLIGGDTGITPYGPTGFYRYTGPIVERFRVEVEAERDGKKSTQFYSHTSLSRFLGYGGTYGSHYGGDGSVSDVLMAHGDTPPTISVDVTSEICPRPTWVAGNWQHIDASVSADGGLGYSSSPAELTDYVHSGTSATFDPPLVMASGAKPYRHKLCCSDGSGASATLIVTNGDTVWKRAGDTSDWEVVTKPTSGIFSSPATVDSICNNSGTFVFCIGKGADIYTTTDLATYTRQGTVSVPNGLLAIMQAEWIYVIGGNYIACGSSMVDYTKTVIASSSDLITWTIRNPDAPSEARDFRNWVWFPHATTPAFYLFCTVGGPLTGSVFAYVTTNGYTFASRSLGAPANTPVIGRGIVFKDDAAAVHLQVFGGAYIFDSTDGIGWTKARTTYAPEQVMAAIASQEPGATTCPGGAAGTNLNLRHILMRSARFLYDASAPSGHPGTQAKGGVFEITSFLNPYVNGSHPELVQPVSLPYGNMIGAVGDLSTALMDSGFSNGGKRSDDVYGFIGKSSGHRYFEVHIATMGEVLIGVAAAVGPGEVVPNSSAVLSNAGRVFTDIRLNCPGGIGGGATSLLVSTPVLSNVVVGIDLNLTALTCDIYLDGALLKSVTGLTAGFVWFPIFNSASAPLKLNLGQTAFQLTPPVGSSAWLA